MTPRILPILALTLLLAPTLRAQDIEDDGQTDIKFADCPAIVQKHLSQESRNAKIDTVVKDVQDGVVWYVAHALIAKHPYEITLDSDGILIEKKLQPESTKQLKLKDCPPPVQKTLTEESAGATIDQIDRETLNGVTTYIAGVEIDDNYYWITLSDQGLLLSKSLDQSDDDSDEDSAPEESPSKVI